MVSQGNGFNDPATPDANYNAKDAYAEMMDFLSQAETKATEEHKRRYLAQNKNKAAPKSRQQGPDLEFDGELAPAHQEDLDDLPVSTDRRRKSNPKNKTMFNRHNNGIAGLTTIEEDDGTYVLIGGAVIKLCYTCNRRLPYYLGQCQNCRTEYSRQRTTRMRVVRRQAIRELLGNKCIRCGVAYDPDKPNLWFCSQDEYLGQDEALDHNLILFAAEGVWQERALRMIMLLCLSCKGHRNVETREQRERRGQLISLGMLKVSDERAKERMLKLLAADQAKKDIQY